MSLVKNTDCVVEPLTHICNPSLQAGIIPSKLKTAKVNPIYKAGDRHVFSNYRPVSLLSRKYLANCLFSLLFVSFLPLLLIAD